jgi:hypothetical protein
MFASDDHGISLSIEFKPKAFRYDHYPIFVPKRSNSL